MRWTPETVPKGRDERVVTRCPHNRRHSAIVERDVTEANGRVVADVRVAQSDDGENRRQQ